MKYALITGGLGFIGSFISRYLIENDIVQNVIALDHYGRYVNSTNPEFIDYRKYRLQGIDHRIIIERGEAKFFSILYKILNKYRPELIFHMAALPLAKLDNLNSEEGLEGAVQSTTNILEIIGQIKNYTPKRFVYTSSSMVYGDFNYEVATEKHPLQPKEIYGTMKLAGEKITLGLGNYYSIPYTIIRPSAVFGPTDMNKRVTQIFVENALKGKKLIVKGDEEKLDFTYIKDVARGFVIAATDKNGINEVFNITHGQAHSLLDFISCLKKHFPNLRYEVQARDKFRPKRGTLSIKKAKDLLYFYPKFSLQEAVDDYISFIKKTN